MFAVQISKSTETKALELRPSNLYFTKFSIPVHAEVWEKLLKYIKDK